MTEGIVAKCALAGTLLVLAAISASPAAALADTGDIIAPQNNPHTAADGWQAGVCTADVPPCSPTTDNQFSTPAAGHPQVGFTQFIVKNEPVVPVLAPEEPVGVLKDIRVDLPVGLSVNPQATPQCDLGSFEAETCPATAQVGTSTVTTAALGVVAPPIVAPVYNLIPNAGEPALFGFRVLGSIGGPVFLKSDIEWNGDYHEGFSIAVPKSPIGKILKNRLTFNGRAGNGTFLTNPSTCLNPAQSPNQHIYSTYLRADSESDSNPNFPNGSTPFESPLPPGVMPTGCNQVPFTPTTAIDPNSNQTDSPVGPTVGLNVPFDPGATIAQSNVRDVNVTLPAGLGLNPAAAPKLTACTDQQFNKGSRAAIACPAGSQIGTAAIETPPLPAGSLKGDVYLATQQSRDPASGNLYRIFLDAGSTKYNVDVRLVGNVKANPATGQLTATFKENPQVPFTSIKLQFDGAKGVLTSPPICTSTATSSIVPWSGTAAKSPQATLTLTKAPGGGACAKTLAARPFAPGFSASPGSNQAAAFTPFSVHITRTDGQQELKGVDITLPPGATAKLAGVPYCPASAIAAAAAAAGSAEKAKSSCPSASQVGVATIAAGSGTTPLQIGGKAFLAGPYKGAPLSLVVITPAVAGPFDLGTVVVRVALALDPETAQIHAISDAIPDVFGGAKLDIRSINVNVNQKEFTLNGTNCSKFATTGALKGGGADPTNPAAFSSFAVSAPSQLTNCDKLGFRPKLNLRLFGAHKRAKHPKLRAVLQTRAGDANMARVSVALPHALFLDQASLGQICTRVQFAAQQCPKKSVYGHARAITPLLGQPLEGPVYLRSSNNTLPDLVAHLEGQVDIDLVGRIDSFKGGVRTTFATVPDVPVTKFAMTLPGGKHGLLVASKNLCKGKVKAIVQIKGQNGKKANKRQKVRTPCGKKHGKKAHGKKKSHKK
jgi:hypothetical protein